PEIGGDDGPEPCRAAIDRTFLPACSLKPAGSLETVAPRRLALREGRTLQVSCVVPANMRRASPLAERAPFLLVRLDRVKAAKSAQRGRLGRLAVDDLRRLGLVGLGRDRDGAGLHGLGQLAHQIDMQ